MIPWLIGLWLVLVPAQAGDRSEVRKAAEAWVVAWQHDDAAAAFELLALGRREQLAYIAHRMHGRGQPVVDPVVLLDEALVARPMACTRVRAVEVGPAGWWANVRLATADNPDVWLVFRWDGSHWGVDPMPSQLPYPEMARAAGSRPGIATAFARTRLEPGHRVQVRDLQWVVVEPWTRPDGVFADSSELVGRQVRDPLLPGEPIRAPRLVGEDHELLQVAVPDGMRGVPVPGAADHLQADDRVDLVLADGGQARLEAEDLRVITVLEGRAILELSPERARVVVGALADGAEAWLLLRGEPSVAGGGL